MATEITRGQRWIYSQLRNSFDIRSLIGQQVYEYPAPQATKPPYVLVDFRGAKDTALLGSTRASVIAFYAVVAVGENSPTLKLELIADAIDAALAGQSGSNGDVQIQACTRMQTLLNASMQSGDNRRSLGGLYRLTLVPLIA